MKTEKEILSGIKALLPEGFIWESYFNGSHDAIQISGNFFKDNICGNGEIAGTSFSIAYDKKTMTIVSHTDIMGFAFTKDILELFNP